MPQAPPEEPKPEEPKPVDPKPGGAEAEEPKPGEPKAEEGEGNGKTHAESSPEALRLIQDAARRQGTQDLVGDRAIRRFRQEFRTIVVYPAKGGKWQTSAVEAFALPAEGSKECRLRSEYDRDGQAVALGHSGRAGWIWTKREGVRRLTDERDEQSARELDDRRRMHRLALRVFFLGNLRADTVPRRLLPDEDLVLPRGQDGKHPAVRCRVLERAASAADGEPPMRLYLDAKTLDPVAALLLPWDPKGPSYLLTLDYEKDDPRKPPAVPAGVRIPFWIELFEVPPGPAAKPAILYQASLDALEIDPAKVPDSLFAVPKE